MKHSIRKQFACIFIGMMVGTVMFCWLLNNVFLEKYYTKQKQKNLLQVYEVINDASHTGKIDTEDFFYVTLSNLCGRYNIDGLVVDVKTQILRAFGTDVKQSQMQLWDNLLFLDRQQGEYLVETPLYKMMVVKDKRSRTDYLEVWGNLENGDLFLLRTPLEGVRDSVQIANRFLAYIGLLAAIGSGIMIWFLTGKYTKPILDLAKISQQVAQLDFNARYNGNQDNEVGILGKNINHMSEELEKTISELKTANNKLKQDIIKKEKIDAIRTEFLSNVSHELKTPIALIQGYAEGLKDGILEEEEDRQFYCGVIVDEAQKMNEMVKKLLNLNQLEYGNDSVTMERFDICSMIHNCIQSSDILIKQKEILVQIEQTAPIYVWADEFKIEEVFMNYFTNAINHAESLEKEEKKIRIDFIFKDNLVRIQVFNTGNLIPEDSLPRIWDKFYKVDKARTREYGGSGVGLSIVKAIMESIHQNYGVENKEHGVLFWFELEKA